MALFSSYAHKSSYDKLQIYSVMPLYNTLKMLVCMLKYIKSLVTRLSLFDSHKLPLYGPLD